MKESSLVTGGAGFIGSHLTDRLIESGKRVVVVDNLFTGKKSNLTHLESSPLFTFLEKDICTPLDEVFSAFNIKNVYHLAAIGRVRYSFAHPEQTHKTNVLGTLNLLEASVKHNVERFIFASSSSIYGYQPTIPLAESLIPNPVSPYGIQKRQAEEYVKWYSNFYGLPTISLRFFNVYGARQRGDLEHAPLIPKVWHEISAGQAPEMYGNGTHTRDFTYVQDIIDGIQLAALLPDSASKGIAINVGAGKNHSVREVMEKIISFAGTSIRPLKVPGANEPSHTLSDLKLARKVLDYSPKMKLEEGLFRTLSWYRAKENQQP